MIVRLIFFLIIFPFLIKGQDNSMRIGPQISPLISWVNAPLKYGELGYSYGLTLKKDFFPGISIETGAIYQSQKGRRICINRALVGSVPCDSDELESLKFLRFPILIHKRINKIIDINFGFSNYILQEKSSAWDPYFVGYNTYALYGLIGAGVEKTINNKMSIYLSTFLERNVSGFRIKGGGQNFVMAMNFQLFYII